MITFAIGILNIVSGEKMKLRHPISIINLTVILALLLTVVSFSGIFIAEIYQRETLSMAAQGVGQDIFDLFIIVPLLLISLFYATKGIREALIILGGSVFYTMYSFFIYSFGIHFNALFIFYCFTLGASFYLFVLIITEFVDSDVENWFGKNPPVKSTALFFVLVAVMFYIIWFSDIIPAMLSNSIPKSVSSETLIVNPVHVMDLAFVLPGLILTSFLLIKKRRLGFVLTLILLIFIIQLSLALIAMAVLLNIRNISEDLSLVGIFVILAVISLIFLTMFMRKMKNQNVMK